MNTIGKPIYGTCADCGSKKVEMWPSKDRAFRRPGMYCDACWLAFDRLEDKKVNQPLMIKWVESQQSVHDGRRRGSSDKVTHTAVQEQPVVFKSPPESPNLPLGQIAPPWQSWSAFEGTPLFTPMPVLHSASVNQRNIRKDSSDDEEDDHHHASLSSYIASCGGSAKKAEVISWLMQQSPTFHAKSYREHFIKEALRLGYLSESISFDGGAATRWLSALQPKTSVVAAQQAKEADAPRKLSISVTLPSSFNPTTTRHSPVKDLERVHTSVSTHDVGLVITTTAHEIRKLYPRFILSALASAGVQQRKVQGITTEQAISLYDAVVKHAEKFRGTLSAEDRTTLSARLGSHAHAEAYLIQMMIAASQETPTPLTQREAFFLALEYVLLEPSNTFHQQATEVRRRFQVASVAPAGVTQAQEEQLAKKIIDARKEREASQRQVEVRRQAERQAEAKEADVSREKDGDTEAVVEGYPWLTGSEQRETLIQGYHADVQWFIHSGDGKRLKSDVCTFLIHRGRVLFAAKAQRDAFFHQALNGTNKYLTEEREGLKVYFCVSNPPHPTGKHDHEVPGATFSHGTIDDIKI